MTRTGILLWMLRLKIAATELGKPETFTFTGTRRTIEMGGFSVSLLILFCRLISERTVEENILKKANQKRLLGDIAIEGGNFTAATFKKVISIFVNLCLSLNKF